MNKDCNTAIKKNGKLCKCRLGLGHLGEHEYKEPTKKDKEMNISNEGCIIGLVVCTGILALFYFSVTGKWVQPPVWWNPIGWGLAVLTLFGCIGWLVFLSTLISNIYWSRKPDEIWIRDSNATEYAKHFGEDFIKQKAQKEK